MIDALGLLEVRGLACGIEAADAMLKAASVRLLRQAVTNPALVTLVVEGDLAACRAALDAGAALASRRGCLVGRKEIGRPEDDTAYLLGTLLDAGQDPAPRPAPAPEEALLGLLARRRQGYSASEVAAAFDIPVAQARAWLEGLFAQGRLRRRSSRYRLPGGAPR
ncbi:MULTISPECIES: BMC domain-containing protein [Pseudomonas]|uniref:BMC domain-containing protein n=1 Tax=Pseudomonas TaxID=286 RepID=UPI000D702BC5|nr:MULTISPECIES: BMC domain-containing protein [unclassified Pseudomonas]MED5610207.1 BMC domain-containing protein [Pseudomonas sp. JH-2]PWU30820.1 ethanolamine utilization protein EutK [Pseudomonas sp. RW407]